MKNNPIKHVKIIIIIIEISKIGVELSGIQFRHPGVEFLEVIVKLSTNAFLCNPTLLFPAM